MQNSARQSQSEAQNMIKQIKNLKNKIENEGILLYRGTGLKKEQLQEYKDLVGETEVRRV